MLCLVDYLPDSFIKLLESVDDFLSCEKSHGLLTRLTKTTRCPQMPYADTHDIIVTLCNGTA